MAPQEASLNRWIVIGQLTIVSLVVSRELSPAESAPFQDPGRTLTYFCRRFGRGSPA